MLLAQTLQCDLTIGAVCYLLNRLIFLSSWALELMLSNFVFIVSDYEEVNTEIVYCENIDRKETISHAHLG